MRVKLTETLQHVTPRSRVVAELKRQARALGGDALLSVTVTPVSGGGTSLSPTGDVLAGNSETWSALVIVWLEPRCRHARPGSEAVADIHPMQRALRPGAGSPA